MGAKEFIKTVNATRLENKGKWYQLQGEVNGKLISIKGYDTWVQRLSVDGVYYANVMGMSVKEFKEFLYICVK